MTDRICLHELSDRLGRVERQLASFARTDLQPHRVSVIAAIVADAAALIRVGPDEILSPSHNRPLSRARAAVFWAARRALGTPWKALAWEIGRRDHTSAIYAVKRAEQLRESCDDFRRLSDLLIERARARKGKAQ